MSEYIDRDVLLRDIEENTVFSGRTPNAEIVGANKVIGRIRAAHIADVEPVIRCKDCVHSKKLFNYCLMCGREGSAVVFPNDFCSQGERRDPNGLK